MDRRSEPFDDRIRSHLRLRGFEAIPREELARLRAHAWEREALLDGLRTVGILLVPLHGVGAHGWTCHLTTPMVGRVPRNPPPPPSYRTLRPIVTSALRAFRQQGNDQGDDDMPDDGYAAWGHHDD